MNKTKDELIIELKELKQKYDSLKEISDKKFIEHKRGEEALRVSEEKFRLIAENTSDGILVLGTDNRIKYVSPSYLKQMGYTEQEDLSRDSESIYSIIHPEDRDVLFALIFSAISEKKSELTYIYRAKHKNGHYIWREDNAKFNYDSNNNYINTYAVCRDITQRKLDEDKLQATEEKFRKIVETSPDGIAIGTLDGKIQFVNDKAISMWGYTSADELVDKNIMEFIHPSYHEKALFLINEMMNGNLTGANDYLMVRKDGSHFYAEANADILRDSNNNPMGILYIQRDITERKQAEVALQESEKRFRNVLQDVKNVAVQAYAPDGTTTYWNKASELLYGYTAQEALGHNLLDLIIPSEMRDEVSHAIKWMAESGQAIPPSELLLKRKDGTRVSVFSHHTIVQVSGKEQELFCIDIDLTDRKQVEDKLKENEHSLRTLFNAMKDVVIEMDYDGRYINIAPTSTELMVNSPELVIGKTMHEIFPKQEADIYLKFVRKCLDENKMNTIEYPMLINNKTVWFEGRAIPKTNNSVLYIGRDITERKQVEQEIEESREKYRGLSEATFDSIFISEKGICIEQNLSAEKIFGYTDDEAIGRKGTDWIAPEYKQLVMSNMLAGYELPYEAIAIKKDGTRFPCSIQGKMMHYKGKTVRVTSLSDITQRKQVEQELIAAKERAEQSDRLKTAFLANMSHEIRTPMNGILGFSSLLKEPSLSGEEQQEYIDIIEKAGARMLNTINNIISISRIEAGELSVSVSNTDINVLLKDVYNFFIPESEIKGLQFSIKRGLSGKKAIIQTDPEKLNSILFNFVKNAIKYTDKGSVEFGYKLKADSDPLELVFYVKDTGIGIPENRQKAIFERFIKADINDKMAMQGSGLGLSIAKAYIEVLGGKIGMESEEGHGSVFYFTLPYSTELQEKELIKKSVLHDIKEKQVDTGVSPLKILIAEDDENAEMYLRVIIKSLCREVLTAETGIEAIEACQNHPDIDLILMDIQMPHTNGYEATREIRKFNKEVIIIAQTAFALAGDREKALEAGCNDYITKPVNKEKMMQLIAKYFQQ